MIQFQIDKKKFVAVRVGNDTTNHVVETSHQEPKTHLFWVDEFGGDDNLIFLPKAEYKVIGLWLKDDVPPGNSVKWARVSTKYGFTDEHLILERL